MPGMHDVDMLNSRLHKNEIAAGVSVLEAPPTVFGGFVAYVETPRGLRAPTSVWAVVRMGCVEIGLRRVNYRVKRMLVDQHGDFSNGHRVDHRQPRSKIVCHPVVAVVMDRLWTSVATKTFLYGRL